MHFAKAGARGSASQGAVRGMEAAAAAWRRRTEGYTIGARLALGLVILIVYVLAPRPTDLAGSGVGTLTIILLYLAFAAIRIALHIAERFEAEAGAASIAVDFALLGFLIDSYQRSYAGGPALALHAPTFAFYFVFIALHGMRLEWRHAIAAGICAMASWAGVVAAAFARAGDGLVTHSYAAYAETGMILLGAEVERMLALAAFTAAIAITGFRAHALRSRLLLLGVKAERERVRAERQSLLHAKQAAERTSELKSQFLAKMSHELRTPLNGVLGFSDLLAQSPLDGLQRQYVATIQSSGETLLGLINSILDLTNIEEGRQRLASEPFNPSRLIDDIGREFMARAEKKGISCRVEVARGFPKAAVGDEMRLRKALEHLADNAVKFTERGGVDIRAFADVGKDGRTIAVIDVKDTGVGVAEGDQARIFEIFEQADNTATRAFDGAGLGLAISKRIIEAMGGRLSVRSTKGAGSTFRAEIPLDAAPIDDAPCMEEMPGKRSVAGAALTLRALIADD
ncbi:MAG: ATP-binding protein, partial [Pseudomonadota bacterium]